MRSARILLPFLLLLLLFVTAAIARVDYEPLSDLESFHVLQQIERGETPEVIVLVRALSSLQMKLRARAAELLGNVQVGSLDEWYALEPLLFTLLFDYPEGATTRWWAHASLQRISGEDFGYRMDAPSPERDVALRQWSTWARQRSIALLQLHPDFSLPPTTTQKEYVENLRSRFGEDKTWWAAFWERAWYTSIAEKEALGVVLLSAILLASTPWLASDRLRAFLLCAFSAILGLGGYAYYDRHYLAALFHLRDVPSVREDCAHLLRMSRTLGGSLSLSPEDPAFPKSFHALRIYSVSADDHTVALHWENDGLYGPYYSYLYDPEGLRASVRMYRHGARHTFWKGLYLFEPIRY